MPLFEVVVPSFSHQMNLGRPRLTDQLKTVNGTYFMLQGGGCYEGEAGESGRNQENQCPANDHKKVSPLA